ncbi:MAG: molybdate ABC transporter permease subunit [Sarcina sp.]
MVLSALIVSLKVAVIATIIVSILAIILARYFLKKKSKTINIIESVIMLPLFVPPSLIGYIVILALGKKTFIGSFLYEKLGFSFIFTIYGAILAVIIVIFPIIYGSTKSAFLSIDKIFEDAAMDLGASKVKTFFKVLLPLSYRQIFSGIILGFARAFGEFGATMMVAGNIEGKTQTIPIALYYSVEFGENSKAIFLSLIILIISTTLIYFYNKFIK